MLNYVLTMAVYMSHAYKYVQLAVVMNITNSGTFVVVPMSVNVTMDTEAVFQCKHPTADSTNWKINGTILRVLPEGVHLGRDSTGVHNLAIMAHPEYNSTMIECVVFFSGSPAEETAPAVMMIQGIPAGYMSTVKQFCAYPLLCY